MQNPQHFGPITCLCLDRKHSWIVVGTSMGILTLWDRRFGLLLKSWQVCQTLPGKSARIHQCAIHPTKGRGKWIMVALESPRASAERVPVTLIEVWDVEKSVLVETFTTKDTSTASEPAMEEPQEINGANAEASPAAAIAALVRSRQPGGYPATSVKRAHTSSSSIFKDEMDAPSSTIRAIVVGLEFGGHQSGHRSEVNDFTSDLSPHGRSLGRGFMISGSEDRRIRLWDFGRLERTSVLSGLESEHDKPSYRFGSDYSLSVQISHPFFPQHHSFKYYLSVCEC